MSTLEFENTVGLGIEMNNLETEIHVESVLIYLGVIYIETGTDSDYLAL